MKLKYEFAVRCVVGEHLLIPMGEGALAFSGMIATSETGAFLAQQLQQDITRAQLLDALLNEYDVDEATAQADLDAFLTHLEELGLLDP